MADHTPSPAPVTDRRVAPPGVLPRGIQTWLMVGLALGIVAIILLTGHPEPPSRSGASATAPRAPSPDRVRDYQDRLRAMEARAAQEAQAAPLVQEAAGIPEEPRPRAAPDPVAAERRRRDYESLFASNVVLSRRPDGERPDDRGLNATGDPMAPGFGGRAEPSIDEIADAVVRATVRAGVTPDQRGTAAAARDHASEQPAARAAGRLDHPQASAHTGAISTAGPLHRLLEGTVIDAVLTNRLDGSLPAPVNCLVTNPVYSHSGQHVVIPAGARLLGETTPVETLGETRLAVAFHRLLLPDGRTHSLEQFLGLNQIGDAGLRDQLNRHYWSTFGAAGAVGLITGLAQYLGTAAFGRGDGNRTVVIAGGATDATAQASLQVLNRFLNRLPTVTIREGHRVKVYLTSDLELPAYQTPARAGGS